MGAAASRVRLRKVVPSDLPVLYRQYRDPGARWMAAFGSRPSVGFAPFRERWTRMLAEPSHWFRTVRVDGAVAGYVGRFPLLGDPSVAYWYGRRYWGRGLATAALRAFLRTDRTRPLFARVAHDHLASRRVLEKCGFVVVGRERSPAVWRGRRVTKLILRLDRPRRPAARDRDATRTRRRRSRRSVSRGA